jgi:predicted esterase
MNERSNGSEGFSWNYECRYAGVNGSGTGRVIEAAIRVHTHGLYLLRASDTPVVGVGFHGYGEDAEAQMSRLLAIPSLVHSTLVSIQGLHRFYQRRTNQVVASWMTRQDRESAIADNCEYVSAVLIRAIENWPPITSVVFAGFSQGVAMAFRAAVRMKGPRCHVISVGGDIPPELLPEDLGRLSSILLCRGNEDPWYSAETFAQDSRRLEESGAMSRTVSVPGGHTWSVPFVDAIETHLRAVLTPAEITPDGAFSGLNSSSDAGRPR